jgi:regulator of protease activity HflC (stomatin/prohibitin superfamily)
MAASSAEQSEMAVAKRELRGEQVMKTSMFVVLAVTNAQAQVSIDVAKITCDQFAAYRITDPRNIAIWLSGYYNGKCDNTVMT